MPDLRRGLAAVASLAVLLAVACASGGEAGYEVDPRDDFATLVVENDNISAVQVHVLRKDIRQRMGTVAAQSSERFEIQRTMLSADGELSVGVDDPLDPDRMYTALILVTEGDVIEVTAGLRHLRAWRRQAGQ